MPEIYQEEIEEILRRSGEPVPVKTLREREQPTDDRPQNYESVRDVKQSRDGQARRWPSLSPGKIMLGGLVLFLIGAITPFSPLLWVGLAVLVGAYLFFFMKPGSTPLEKRWRSRSVEDELDEDGLTVDKLKKWLRR